MNVVARWKQFAPVLLVICSAVIVCICFFGGDSFSDLRRLRAALMTQRAANRVLNDQVTRMRREVRGLQSDPRALEKAARNELSLARPGEMVFFFEDGEPMGARAQSGSGVVAPEVMPSQRRESPLSH